MPEGASEVRVGGASAPRVCLLCSEPVGERMGGIGIRYVEFARHLRRAGLDPFLVAPCPDGQAPESVVDFRPFRRGRLSGSLRDCDVAVAQGPLADDLLREVPDLPVAIDLYDPWLVENYHYVLEEDTRPYRRDLASWLLQLSRGDLFLCSSIRQRTYYLGLLTALGRMPPDRLAVDPSAAHLVAEVPFGVPSELPPHRPVLPEREPGGRLRVLFGGVYDWNDPEVVLEALDRIEEDRFQVLFFRHPGQRRTPQRRMAALEALAQERGWLGNRVVIADWVPADRRFDLVRDVDALLVTHRSGVETDLSFRTRVLEGFAAERPVLLTAGSALDSLAREHGAARLFPPGDPRALATALRELVNHPEEVARRVRGGRRLASRFRWERVLEPLVRFCEAPRRDPWKEGPRSVVRILERRRRWHRARYAWARAIHRFQRPW